jgi:dTDP-4-dehydrorhamnose reductase
LDLPTLDFTQPETIRTAMRSIAPEVVVNAAAYTAVDQAEREDELAFGINARAPAVLAEECSRLGALFVHYSTDYVFDGTKTGAYVEDDPPNPLCVYGRSKLEGEQSVRDSRCPHLVLRTSWVYGARARSFFGTVLRLGRERGSLSIVDDQIGAPTWARTLSDVTAQLVARWLRAAPAEREALSGTYHATAAGHTSWYGFATAIFERTTALGLGPSPTIAPIPTSEYRTPARRPMNSLLNNSKLNRVFGLALPPWDTSLTLCMAELAERTALDLGAHRPMPRACDPKS